jgi:uncharacterized iron-regulated membrane protein
MGAGKKKLAMTKTQIELEQSQQSHNRLYRAVWRWHFYSGLFVAPFLLMLAVSGLFILWFTTIAPEYGDMQNIQKGQKVLSVTEQAAAALKSYPNGKIGQYIAPRSETNPALFRVDLEAGNRIVALDPYTGSVVRDGPQAGTWNEFITDIHGTFLVGGDGGIGDFLIEAAASLGIISVVTGLFLWWPRIDSIRNVLWPQFSAKGRAWWKSIHEVLGFWMSIFLVFFLISGLAWTTVWGSKYVQAWSTFPAEKWDNVPLSNVDHASMNHGAMKEVPWTLEQTLLPESGSNAGITGLPSGIPVNWDSVSTLARALGFSGRFQLAAPKDDKGVWSISRDSQSYDSSNPFADRTVHVDQYTGKILADVTFADYSAGGKAMAVGIALHEGQTGWWNIAFNTLYCLAVIFMAVSGIVMWWKRRPAAQLGAPLYPRNFVIPKAALGIGAVLAICFPLGGAILALFAIVDYFLPARLKEVGA